MRLCVKPKFSLQKMSKRPKGLQAQRLAKKLKEEETLTIEVEAGEDEVEELSQLYDSAIQHLSKITF